MIGDTRIAGKQELKMDKVIQCIHFNHSWRDERHDPIAVN